MYPRAEQFADWIDSFVHRDEDTLPVSAVEQLPELLNNKYPATDGEELRGDHDRLAGDLAAHETANAAEFTDVHEEITALEEQDTAILADIGAIRDMLKEGATLAQAKAALVALGDNYKDVHAIASTLETFLRSTDIADVTINTWKEIELFLQGITDTKSLTALLEALESKITGAYTSAIAAAVAVETTRARTAENAVAYDVAVVRQAVLALMAESAGRVVPLIMHVTAPDKITAGNTVVQYIRAILQPVYALQNVLFLGDGKAVDVEPDGSITPLATGKSRVHVIPTENTALHQTVEIEVVNPAFILAEANVILLDFLT